MAADDPAAESAEFHAIYRGETFGAPRRGALAVLAHGVGAGRSSMEAAQISTQSFAEGYFGAPATLGAGPAAARSLASVNAWLFSQSRRDPERLGMAASLSALTFGASKKIGVIHVGDCRVYRKRRGALEALTDDHLRRVAGDAVLTRAVGADTDVQADFLDADAEPFDRFILVSPGFAARPPPARLNQTLSLDLPAETLAQRAVAEAGAPATAVVIDIVAVPEPQFDDVAAAHADLPLRPPPQDGDSWDGFIVGRTLYRSRYTLLKLARDTADNRQVVLKFPCPPWRRIKFFARVFCARRGLARRCEAAGPSAISICRRSAAAAFILSCPITPDRRSNNAC